MSFAAGGREFLRQIVEGKKEFLKADVLGVRMRKLLW